MGRTRLEGGPAVSAGQVNGERTLGWCDGHYAGDSADVKEAKWLESTRTPLLFQDATVDGWDLPLVYAAAVIQAVLGDVMWGVLPDEAVSYLAADDDSVEVMV